MTTPAGRPRVLVLGGLLALAGLATLAHGPLPTRAYDVLYLLVVLGAAGWALWFASRHRPDRRPFVVLLAAGLVLNGIGDVVWTVDSWSRVVPDASPADIFYLTGLVAMTAALLGAVAKHGSRVDVDAVIDVVTIGAVAVMVMWQTALSSVASDAEMDLLGRVVLIAYPVLDAVLIGLVVRLSWKPERRTWLGPMFAVGILCWLASDLAYLYSFVPGGGDRWMSLGWMVGGCLMAFGLVPVERATVKARRRTGSMGRLLVAILPLAVPTGLFTADPDAVADVESHVWVVLGGTLLLIALALVRAMRLLRSEQEVAALLEAARDDALAASRAKSDFVATMSHELRTPLNGVLGLTTLLLDTELDATQRRYAEESSRAGVSLLRIINDVLDFSKFEAGHLTIEDLDLDLREVLDDVAAVTRPPGGPGGPVSVDVVLDAEVPLDLRGDPHRLRQVLLNLTSNAVKFTRAGEIVVEARVVAADEDLVRLRLEVRDTGLGIASADLQRMFEPFVQADSSTTREYGGTGLGLAISRRLVEAMGGHLEVASTPEVGSSFWFELPLRRGTTAAVTPASPPPAVLASAPIAQRALVVQAEEIDQIVAEGILRHLGLDVQVVADAAAARAALAHQRFDVLVVDARADDSEELTRARVGVPGIAVADDAGTHERAARLGFDAVVDSPLEPVGLRLALELVPEVVTPLV